VKFHQNAKNQNKLGLQPLQSFFGTFFKKQKIQDFWTWFTRFRAPTLGGHQTTTRFTKKLLSCMSYLTCPVPNLARSAVLWMVAIKVKQKTSSVRKKTYK
jgi:hypothetical protein